MYYSEKEIIDIVKRVKGRLREGGIFSGLVAIENREGGYRFADINDLKRF